MAISYSDMARQFLSEHGVYKYGLKKISDMSDKEVFHYCHCYCEENHLNPEWRSFRNKFETEYCNCPYLNQYIEHGLCCDLQMVGNQYILPNALPDLTVDRASLRESCSRCRYNLDG